MHSSSCENTVSRLSISCSCLKSKFDTVSSSCRCVFYGDLYPTKETYHAITAQKLTLLMQVRKLYAYGRTVDYFTEPQKNCVGFVRMGDGTHDGCAVVMSNKEEKEG